MQGDTIFLLVFIFIVLIAVGIIGVLYFMHVSKYDESNTFYKNLLEIIKDNPSLSNDLEDKLLDKNFSIDDVSTSQRDLSNIFGAKLFNEQQIELVKDTNKRYTNQELSNLKDTDEYRYLKDSYAVLDDNSNSNLFNISSTFFNNIDDHTGVTSNFNEIIQIMNMNTSSNISLKTEIDSLNSLNDLQNFYTISADGSDLQINDSSNLKVTKLSICDTNYDNCFELSVDSNKRLVGKSTDSSLTNLQNDKLFVFAGDDTGIYLPGSSDNYELKEL
jgi:hypothetical protein